MSSSAGEVSATPSSPTRRGYRVGTTLSGGQAAAHFYMTLEDQQQSQSDSGDQQQRKLSLPAVAPSGRKLQRRPSQQLVIFGQLGSTALPSLPSQPSDVFEEEDEDEAGGGLDSRQPS